ncbi:MAG: TonB family protein [Cyclobacteriaceae bacterium]|nr:TonB family protein [Cyclobacteriaceae bacterium]
MNRIIYLFALLFFCTPISFAQEGDYGDNKTALIIGNSSYTDAPLKNPENDAKVISETLRELGFDVLEYTNLDGRGMKMAMREFSEKLKEKPGVGLFYYAGHGIQSGGTNYLVPINSNIEEQFEIEFECIEADRALAVMELSNNPFNIVIMDACRNNPFRSFSRSAGDAGFKAPSNPPTGSIIAFATQPGKTASDGTGENGLYTQELVKAMKMPGIPIEDVFKQVRINVSRMSDSKQVPQEWSSLMGDFYFKDKPAPPPVVAEQPTTKTTSGSKTVTVDSSEPQISFGTATKILGSIELTTMMSGIFYMDGEVKNNGEAISTGLVIPINDITIGTHILELRGQAGTWKQQISVRPNETTKVLAELANNSIVSSSGRDINSTTSKPTTNTINTPPINLIPKDNGDIEIYGATEVDSEAEPIQGMAVFQMFLKDEVVYPKKSKITGQVQVQFTVEKSGVVSDVKVVRSLGSNFDEEAIRVLNEIGYCWKPAIKNGKSVRQTVVIPVPFSR